jgi:anti-sigma regulatory factor (Ser/Thr protein kinase)
MNAVAECGITREEAEVASASIELQPALTAPGLARAFTRQLLHRWGEADELVDAAVLVVCELVTNAVRHGAHPPQSQGQQTWRPDGSITLTLTLRPDRLHTEVRDASTDLPVPRTARRDDSCGRGLAIIAALAGSWTAGWAPGGGKWVRACLPRVAVPVPGCV